MTMMTLSVQLPEGSTSIQHPRRVSAMPLAEFCTWMRRVSYFKNQSSVFSPSRVRGSIFYCSFRAPWVLWVAHFLYTFIGIYLLLKK